MNKVQQTNVIHYIHWISVLVLSVSLSAYMKNAISVFYRYRPIRKLSLSGFIGIGRYEKKLIGRTLGLKRAARGLRTAACKVGARFERGLSEV